LSERRERDSKYLSLFFITQDSIRENWKHVFEYDCDILARVMYIKLSRRKFRAKIDFYRFCTTFMGLRDELADRRNRTIFEFLEFNEDGEFDIMFLM
jgi:hypothetical protein